MTDSIAEHRGQRPLRFVRLWLAIGWLMLLVLTLLMALPAPDLQLDIEDADKGVHVLAFAVLAAWYALIYRPSQALARCALGLLSFAVLTELMQVAIPWRSGDLADLLADLLGIGLGMIVAWTPLARLLQQVEARLPGGDRNAPVD